MTENIKQTIKITIVDDNEISILNCIKIIKSMNLSDIHIDRFNDSKKIMDIISESKKISDIIILDIDMPEPNGFDIAEVIHKKFPDVIIMFYTAHEQYVFQSFEFQPFRYIRKEYADKELPFAVKSAIDLIKSRLNKNIIIKCEDENFVVNTENIMYFETNKKMSDIHLSDNRIISTRKTIKQLTNENDDNFFCIYKGIVVNIKYICNYTNSDITLQNGETLFMSRRKYKEFKKAFINYLRNEQ